MPLCRLDLGFMYDAVPYAIEDDFRTEAKPQHTSRTLRGMDYGIWHMAYDMREWNTWTVWATPLETERRHGFYLRAFLFRSTELIWFRTD